MAVFVTCSAAGRPVTEDLQLISAVVSDVSYLFYLMFSQICKRDFDINTLPTLTLMYCMRCCIWLCKHFASSQLL